MPDHKGFYIKLFLISISLLSMIGLGSKFILSYHNNRKSLDECYAPDISCGYDASLVVFSKLGLCIDNKKLLDELKSGINGVSFAQLKNAFRRRRLKTSLCRIDWNELGNSKAAAIFFVNKNHFVTVDARQIKDDKICIYDVQKPSQWITREKLEEMWKGETLIVYPLEKKRGAHKLVWDRCFVDFGFLDHTETVKEIFYVYNGTKNSISLDILKIGCGCTEAKIFDKIIKPGEKGRIEATVDLRDKRGYFSTRVYIKTNDETIPLQYITIRGGVYNPEIISNEVIYFGDIVRETSKNKNLIVYDRGDKTLSIKELKVVQMKSNPLVSMEFKVVKVEDTSKLNKMLDQKIQTGDYIITMRASSEDLNTGLFEGHIEIKTDWEDEPIIIVPFKGNIVHDITVKPLALMVAFHNDRKLNSAELNLHSLNGLPFHIDSVGLKNNKSLGIDYKSENINNSNYKIKIFFSGEVKSNYNNDQLVLNFSDESFIEIPVVFYASP